MKGALFADAGLNERAALAREDLGLVNLNLRRAITQSRNTIDIQFLRQELGIVKR